MYVVVHTNCVGIWPRGRYIVVRDALMGSCQLSIAAALCVDACHMTLNFYTLTIDADFNYGVN